MGSSTEDDCDGPGQGKGYVDGEREDAGDTERDDGEAEERPKVGAKGVKRLFGEKGARNTFGGDEMEAKVLEERTTHLPSLRSRRRKPAVDPACFRRSRARCLRAAPDLPLTR